MRQAANTLTLAAAMSLAWLAGCSSTTAVRTSGEKYPRTNWKDVQVLTAPPSWSYAEIGSLNTSGWKQKKTKDLYKELSKEAASLGAHAVLITESGVSGIKDDQWIRAAAIRKTQEPDAAGGPGRETSD